MHKRLMFLLAATAAMVAAPVAAQDDNGIARTAIASARGKIAMAATLGVGRQVPNMVQDATAALRSAEDDFRRGARRESLANALLAEQIAETAIGVTKSARDYAVAVQLRRADIAAQAQLVAAREGRTIAPLTDENDEPVGTMMASLY